MLELWRAQLQLVTSLCPWQRQATPTWLKLHPPKKFLWGTLQLPFLDLCYPHANSRHGIVSFSYRWEPCHSERLNVIHSWQLRFFRFFWFHTQFLSPYGLPCYNAYFCKRGSIHARLVKGEWCWYKEETVLVHICFILIKETWNNESRQNLQWEREKTLSLLLHWPQEPLLDAFLYIQNGSWPLSSTPGHIGCPPSGPLPWRPHWPTASLLIALLCHWSALPWSPAFPLYYFCAFFIYKVTASRGARLGSPSYLPSCCWSILWYMFWLQNCLGFWMVCPSLMFLISLVTWSLNF